MATFASESVPATNAPGRSSSRTHPSPYREPSAAHAPENEPTSPVSPLAPYPPVLPTESRSRAPEFYGFVAWASTYLLFVLYLLWAFLPDEYIVALGVSWYPNREWSLLIPAYGMVTVLLTYFTYFALALAGTPAFDDMSTITDSKAHLPRATADADPDANANAAEAPRARYAPYLAHARPDAIPEMYDIPLGLVNRVVYGPRRQPRRRATSPPSEPEPTKPARGRSSPWGEVPFASRGGYDQADR